MHGYEMRFPGFDARSNLGPIRWELFLHRDVRDVVPTPLFSASAVWVMPAPSGDTRHARMARANRSAISESVRCDRAMVREDCQVCDETEYLF